MEDEKLQELLGKQAQSEHDIENLRTPMTILFSDIKGSTRFAEKRGDVEYMAMLNRHNSILFPAIEVEGGIVVKTIGDSILAKFDDPVAAIRAAAGMQRALARDREGREEMDQIRVRIGLHHGFGLLRDNDVFGDVVNAASRIERLAEAEQILITDVLLAAATAAGLQCAKMGRADLKGKDAPMDVYAVAWSESSTRELLAEIQSRYYMKLKEMKREHAQLEEEFENAREQWRNERRTLNTEIETLEQAVERARESVRRQLTEELQTEQQFQVEELNRSREQLAEDLASMRQKFEAERNSLKAQILAMESSFIDVKERSNNPARLANAVREQVEARMAEAKQEWELQWASERKRLLAEVERLRKSASSSGYDDKKEAARRAVLEKLGKLPSGSRPVVKTAEQWEHEFQDARIDWETERDKLTLRVKKLEGEMQRTRESLRTEVFEEFREEYESRVADANRERQRLQEEVQSAAGEFIAERERLNVRIKALETTLQEAHEASRKQAVTELEDQHQSQLEEANRLRSRLERKHTDAMEALQEELREAKKHVALLEERLKGSKDAKYQEKNSGRFISVD